VWLANSGIYRKNVIHHRQPIKVSENEDVSLVIPNALALYV
jgi:hypothetical protein